MPLPRNRDLDLSYLLRTGWWDKVEIRAVDECWPWTRSAGSHGYGQTWDGITVRLSHRVAWALHNEGQVPVGMTIDHRPTCLRICCNPHHLRPLSNLDNAMGNGQSRRTHCPVGHPYDERNTMTRTTRDGHVYRQCRECKKRWR